VFLFFSRRCIWRFSYFLPQILIGNKLLSGDFHCSLFLFFFPPALVEVVWLFGIFLLRCAAGSLFFCVFFSPFSNSVSLLSKFWAFFPARDCSFGGGLCPPSPPASYSLPFPLKIFETFFFLFWRSVFSGGDFLLLRGGFCLFLLHSRFVSLLSPRRFDAETPSWR